MQLCNSFTEQDILKFISGFRKENEKQVVKLFTEGYCYWFAYILQTMFGGVLYYLPISGHFVIQIGDYFYDIHGRYEVTEPCLNWEQYRAEDPLQYERIVKDCILKQ
jgi:hypothetical protein